MKPLGICTNLLSSKRERFGRDMNIRPFLDRMGVPYVDLDCYAYDIVDRMGELSGIYWWYSHYAFADKAEAQHILDIAERRGLRVYPDHNTAWHFDDKIAEMYALQDACAPIPESWVFYRKNDCDRWIDECVTFPIVAKLRNGSGSTNVKILRTKKQAHRYCRRMFANGYRSAPSFIYKTYSKAQSTRDLQTLVHRARQIPNFLKARAMARGLGREREYCYFQEFVPNEGYDLKIVVVGDKLGFLARSTRKGDFRASGGGDIYYDRSLVTNQIIDDAFRIADSLKSQCMGFDFVVDSRTGRGVIVEMCHGFDHEAIYEAGGYFDRQGTWHDDPLHCGEEIVHNMYADEIDERGGISQYNDQIDEGR